MCKGLAIIVENLNGRWKVHLTAHVGGHDELLSTLSDDLKYGKVPHLKFELLYPNILKDDITQDVEDYYPDDWLTVHRGIKHAKNEVFEAVWKYLGHCDIDALFTTKMYQGANLSGADLSWAIFI